ncbi:hypothetical protein E3N88_26060 [Mikania micrantha]|uniref:DUF223 domain-containing protein n=1 Tax=Mikania micrantha TaxID=192012 RepID=A0A5N6N996_9ASTR|nr:hypothetical protein E3N88_26060 [Mikania micrantha]
MIEAVCSKKYLIKFQKLLKDGDCFIIRKPSLGDNMSPYKILNHPYKVHLHWGSTVVKCMEFRGTQYGFSFSPFEQFIQNSKSRIIYVTLWDSYADKFSEYMADKEPGRPYVSTTYFATNLFINSDIDDTNQFKSKLHCNDQQTTSSSYRVIGSSLVTLVEDDFLSKTALNTVIEVNDIAEVLCEHDDEGNYEENQIFECNNDQCSQKVIDPLPRTVHRNGNSQHSFTACLKRNLEDVYDVDDSPCESISKSRKKLMDGNEPKAVFSQKLLTSKIEK